MLFTLQRQNELCKSALSSPACPDTFVQVSVRRLSTPCAARWTGSYCLQSALGLAHFLVHRCPQCPCQQNSNKITTRLSGSRCYLQRTQVTDYQNPISAVNNVMSLVKHMDSSGCIGSLLKYSPARQIYLFFY